MDSSDDLYQGWVQKRDWFEKICIVRKQKPYLTPLISDLSIYVKDFLSI